MIRVERLLDRFARPKTDPERAGDRDGIAGAGITALHVFFNV